MNAKRVKKYIINELGIVNSGHKHRSQMAIGEHYGKNDVDERSSGYHHLKQIFKSKRESID